MLHSICSLLCVVTNCTPHERFFNFQKRFCSGKSLPTRLSCLGKAFVRRFVRNSKSELVVDEVKLINGNPTYADVRYRSGREATIRDLAPCPQLANNDVEVVRVQPSVTDHAVNVDSRDLVKPGEDCDVSINVDLNGKSNEPGHTIRRSSRSRKGVFPRDMI